MRQRSVAFRADTAMIRPRWNLEPGTQRRTMRRAGPRHEVFFV